MATFRWMGWGAWAVGGLGCDGAPDSSASGRATATPGEDPSRYADCRAEGVRTYDDDPTWTVDITVAYDAYGWPTLYEETTDGSVVRYSYENDPFGNNLLYELSFDGMLMFRQSGTYDADGNPVHVAYDLGGDGLDWIADYTSSGGLLRSAEIDVDGDETLDEFWSYDYDADGALTHAEAIDGDAEVIHTFDATRWLDTLLLGSMEEVELEDGVPTYRQNDAYLYDASYRLTRATTVIERPDAAVITVVLDRTFLGDAPVPASEAETTQTDGVETGTTRIDRTYDAAYRTVGSRFESSSPETDPWYTAAYTWSCP